MTSTHDILTSVEWQQPAPDFIVANRDAYRGWVLTLFQMRTIDAYEAVKRLFNSGFRGRGLVLK